LSSTGGLDFSRTTGLALSLIHLCGFGSFFAMLAHFIRYVSSQL
jgi:hypothetical protein